MRLRWIENLMTKKELHKEKIIVDALISNINNISGLKIFLYKKNHTRSIQNEFYRNTYIIWKKHNIIFEPVNINSIKNDWIYDNILLTDDDGRVFKPPGIENLPNYFPKTFKELPVIVTLGDLRGVHRSLIPKWNQAFYKIKFSDSDSDCFKLIKQSDNHHINLNDEFKVVYTSIVSNNISTVKIWENKWRIDLGNNNIIWEKVWENVHNTQINYKVQSSVWEMIHRNYICGYSLRQMNIGDGLCKLCKEPENQRTHIFMQCRVINSIYQYFIETIHKLCPEDISIEEKAFGGVQSLLLSWTDYVNLVKSR